VHGTFKDDVLLAGVLRVESGGAVTWRKRVQKRVSSSFNGERHPVDASVYAMTLRAVDDEEDIKFSEQDASLSIEPHLSYSTKLNKTFLARYQVVLWHNTSSETDVTFGTKHASFTVSMYVWRRPEFTYRSEFIVLILLGTASSLSFWVPRGAPRTGLATSTILALVFVRQQITGGLPGQAEPGASERGINVLLFFRCFFLGVGAVENLSYFMIKPAPADTTAESRKQEAGLGGSSQMGNAPKRAEIDSGLVSEGELRGREPEPVKTQTRLQSCRQSCFAKFAAIATFSGSDSVCEGFFRLWAPLLVCGFFMVNMIVLAGHLEDEDDELFNLVGCRLGSNLNTILPGLSRHGIRGNCLSLGTQQSRGFYD
jgi:hypothetical protein